MQGRRRNKTSKQYMCAIVKFQEYDYPHGDKEEWVHIPTLLIEHNVT
jgi:hypothetical protein